MHPSARTARTTGLFYLGNAVTGVLGFLIVRPRLFAAGDLRKDSPRQLVNAASDGATAAIAAHRYLSVAPEGASV